MHANILLRSKYHINFYYKIVTDSVVLKRNFFKRSDNIKKGDNHVNVCSISMNYNHVLTRKLRNQIAQKFAITQ